MCALLAAGVFGAVVLATVRAHGTDDRAPCFRQSIVAELVWAAIPCLIVIAAALPAAISIIAANR